MIELWSSHKFGIVIGGIVVCLLGFFVFATIFLDMIIKTPNASKYTAIGTILAAIGTIVAAIVGLAALCFVGYQAIHLKKSVDLQREEFALEHRPYLYVELKLQEEKLSSELNGKAFEVLLTGIWPTDKKLGYFGGGDLYFRNVGKDPATITQTKYIVHSDVNKDLDLVEWFKNATGDFPDITSVMPNQQNLRVPCHPIVSHPTSGEAPKLLFIGAVISYVGPQKETEKERRYWYKFSQLFIIEMKKIDIVETRENDTKKNHPPIIIPVLHPHVMKTDWDRNNEEDPTPLEDPDWDELLKKSYIRKLTEKNRL